MMKTFKATLLALALCASGAAFAQSGAAEPTATLRVNQGSIMVSTGGEFTTANTGMSLTVGERLMVAEGASATVVYDNRCNRTYDTAGVYQVEDEGKCVPAAIAGEAVKDSTVATVVAVGMVLAPLLIEATNNDNKSAPTPPVSR